ncbi:MAG: glucosaminidase domain-containing protein [Bacteroidota bacterium]
MKQTSKRWRFYKTLLLLLVCVGLPFILQYNHYFLPKILRFGPPPHVRTFIQQYRPMAEQEMQRSGVLASITLAQAMLETGYGSSQLAREGKNFFGIKCHNRYTRCKYWYKNDYYRCYDNESDSFSDHSDFLLTKPFIRNLLSAGNCDYRAWTKTLTDIHYAEDPLYENKLNDIIQRYHLTRLDKRTDTSISCCVW